MTGLAPWESEFPFPGSITFTFLEREGTVADRAATECEGGAGMMARLEKAQEAAAVNAAGRHLASSSPVFFITLELRVEDQTIYEPQIRALLGTAPHFY